MSQARILLSLLCFLNLSVATAELPKVTDLQADARLSAQSGKPIMVFFAADSCDFCKIVSELYLEPMYDGGQYTDKIIFRKLDVVSSLPIRDFDGRKIHQNKFASREGASFTPVIRLYNAKGKELVPELLGYTTPDYYAAYLEAAIDNAAKKLAEHQ